MKKRIGVIFLVFLVFVLCAMAFTACHGGKYKMQDFIVDFEDFAKTYEVGDQVDLTKIKMYATFSDGTQEQIPLDKVSIKVDGVDVALNELTKITETVGTKIVEIKYSNVVRSVTIRVNEKHIAVLTSVTFNDANLRKQYNVNDTVSFAGLVVTAVYDGYENRNVELTDQNLAFFMGDENITGNLSRITEALGDKAIKVRYMTMTSTAAFTITVSDVLDSVVVDVPTTLKTSYKVNDAISFATVTATANYRSGRTEAAEVKYYLGDDEITNLSTLTATAGTKTVIAKATYQGVSGQKSIAINVENWIQSISLDTTGVHLGVSCHHQVVQLVNDDNYLRQLVRTFALIAFLHPFFYHMAVVSRQVSYTCISKELISVIHLGYSPCKCSCCLLYIGNNGNYQMRYTVISDKLNSLGIDHDHLDIGGL